MSDDPKTYKEVLGRKDRDLWFEAMNDKLRSLEKNKTWTLVEKSKNQIIVGCKQIFRKREGIPGVEKPSYKSRLLAKRFTQVEGVDFNEIFFSVVKHSSIRIILALVNHFNMKLEQLEVKTAFLHMNLEETIYMSQREGYYFGRQAVVLEV